MKKTQTSPAAYRAYRAGVGKIIICALFAAVYFQGSQTIYAASNIPQIPSPGSVIEMMLLYEQNEASESVIPSNTDTPDYITGIVNDLTSIFDLTGMTDPVKASQPSQMTQETTYEPDIIETDTEDHTSETIPVDTKNLAGTPGYDENGVLIPMPKFLDGTQPKQFPASYYNTTTASSDSSGEIAYTGTGHITKKGGVFYGPSGKETYYNLPMNGVVRIMRRMGYSEEEYPYWVREDGAKMLGDYIMVAAHLGLRPRGTILETSLGTAMVCDTGTFALTNPTQLDLALDW